MDRDEALKLLKGGSNGIDEWNRWRDKKKTIPGLSFADLSGANLRFADLNRAGGSGDTIPISDFAAGRRSTSGTTNLGGFGLGFVLGGFAKDQSALRTVVAEQNAVAAATLLKSSHQCGSNLTGTLLPVCYQGRQFGRLRLDVSL